MNPPPISFDHAQRVAYQRRLQGVVWAHRMLEHFSATRAAHNWLDRASTSVP